MNPKHHRKLKIQGPDLEENARWRQIREMDYEITKNYPEQMIIDSPFLAEDAPVSPKTGLYSGFKDLMMNGPADGIPHLIVKEKKKRKATLTDQLDVVMVEVPPDVNDENMARTFKNPYLRTLDGKDVL